MRHGGSVKREDALRLQLPRQKRNQQRADSLPAHIRHHIDTDLSEQRAVLAGTRHSDNPIFLRQ